jgi:NhaP-type Na+/H+ and K+/H+ antiporter
MLAFTVVLLELGMWSRTLQAEQSSVKLFFLAHTVGSIVTSGLQGVIRLHLNMHEALQAGEVLC